MHKYHRLILYDFSLKMKTSAFLSQTDPCFGNQIILKSILWNLIYENHTSVFIRGYKCIVTLRDFLCFLGKPDVILKYLKMPSILKVKHLLSNSEPNDTSQKHGFSIYDLLKFPRQHSKVCKN